MNQCKRLSDCPADRLAQCRGQAVQARCDALQGLLNKADQQISDLTHAAPVPAGFASGRDEDNMVLLDKRDLFDAVRGALKDAMEDTNVHEDQGELWSWATAAATTALKDLVAKGAVPPAGDVARFCIYNEDGKLSLRPTADGYWCKHEDVTRLTAERDEAVKRGDVIHKQLSALQGLAAERLDVIVALRAKNNVLDALCEQRFNEIASLQSELTKARERMDIAVSLLRKGLNRGSAGWDICVTEFLHPLRHQTATPTAHNADESCGQDAEAAKGERS